MKTFVASAFQSASLTIAVLAAFLFVQLNQPGFADDPPLAAGCIGCNDCRVDQSGMCGTANFGDCASQVVPGVGDCSACKGCNVQMPIVIIDEELPGGWSLSCPCKV